MKLPALILIFVFALSCGVSGDKPRPSDQEAIQGVWLAQTESQNGTQKNVSYLYAFVGNKVTFTDETGKEAKYLFKLDTTGQLKYLIIQPDDTLSNPTPVSVGYELEGDSLKIVIAPAGLRPTEMSDKNDQELIICRRKKS